MWTKKTPLAALLFTIARSGSSGVEAKRKRSPKSPKEPKQPKAVCLEYGFETDVVVAGSPDPVGTNGPTGLAGCANPSTGVCCTEGLACFTSGAPSDDCDAYNACLQDPANGPVLVGKWWLQPDVSYGEVYFTEDAVCGAITSTEDDSRTRLQLWEETYINMELDRFKKFSVDYNFISTGGSSGGYLNFYLRTDGTSSEYFDCRIDYSIPNAVGIGTLEIFPYTKGTANTWSTGDGTGCSGQISVLDYLDANSGAVMGVGNTELYTFVLNGGSTGQDNSGQEICWSDVSIQHYDNITGDILVTTYDFTTL